MEDGFSLFSSMLKFSLALLKSRLIITDVLRSESDLLYHALPIFKSDKALFSLHAFVFLNLNRMAKLSIYE